MTDASDLPGIAPDPKDGRIRPVLAGVYVVQTAAVGTLKARWDGVRWFHRAIILRNGDVLSARGPLPGTETQRQDVWEEEMREDLLRIGLPALLKEAGAPGTQDAIKATIKRLGARLTLKKK